MPRLRNQSVPLRHQTVIRLALLGLVCLLSGGCARLLQAIIAPQETMTSTAGELVNRAGAGAGRELNGLGQEVDRLKKMGTGDVNELNRLNQELQLRKSKKRSSGASAQRDPARRQPWDLRTTPVAVAVEADELILVRRSMLRPRGEPPSSLPIPDGTPPALTRTMLETDRIRSIPRLVGQALSEP